MSLSCVCTQKHSELAHMVLTNFVPCIISCDNDICDCFRDGVSKVFCVLRTQAGVERVWDLSLPAGRLGLTCSMTPFMLAHCKAWEHLAVKSLQLSCSPEAYFAIFALYKVSILLSSNNSFVAAYARISRVAGLYGPCNQQFRQHCLTAHWR